MSLSCDLFRAECHCIWQLLLQQGFLWQLQPLGSALKSPAQWGCIQGSALNNCSPLRTLRSQGLFLQGKFAAISSEFYWAASKITEPQPGLGWVKAEGIVQPNPLLWGCSTGQHWQDSTGIAEFSRSQSWLFHGVMTCPGQITCQDEGEAKRQGKGGAGWGLLPWAAPWCVITPTQHLI